MWNKYLALAITALWITWIVIISMHDPITTAIFLGAFITFAITGMIWLIALLLGDEIEIPFKLELEYANGRTKIIRLDELPNETAEARIKHDPITDEAILETRNVLGFWSAHYHTWRTITLENDKEQLAAELKVNTIVAMRRAPRERILTIHDVLEQPELTEEERVLEAKERIYERTREQIREHDRVERECLERLRENYKE